ncbi:lipopolysaccharide biosynthesis protein [Streptomyces pathocidini]|uniref:Lipopolysaccharide biosynthesis protein n=1 Tax=Streptomyces pathocidini TaxID=1650571 RepID=A0ABW7UUW0_9ACTN
MTASAVGGSPSDGLEAPGGSHDEPDLLRDQFRQLLRYRVPLVLGVLVGLLGGGWIGLAGGDTYVATSEVTVRPATVDPFAAGGTPDKQVSIGSERQTAVSNAVAARAAKALGTPADDVDRLQAGLQVTNPPNTLVLRFSYTDPAPGRAAERANAFTRAYLDNRRRQTQSLIDNMVAAYQKQLDPLEKQRDQLAEQIAQLSDGRALDTTLSVQSGVLGKISELSSSVTKLKALDTTPGFVVRTATPPREPSGPGLPLLLGIGAAVGVGLGLLAAWARLVFDPTARSESDVVRALRAPVLGVLPRGRRRVRALRRGRRGADAGEPLAGALPRGRRADAGEPLAEGRRRLPREPLAAGRLAEEYRSVAFRLAYDQRFADRRRLLVVAPRGAIDTAAAVAVNLAASFVEMGREVMLVEADLRTPSLATRLRPADGPRPGWAVRPGARGSLGRGDGGWPTGEQFLVDTGESGMFDLVPGARVRNVARALTSTQATRLIATADAPGTVAVVLAPAVLSYADAIALADRVDGVLVVCDPRAVHRADLARVRELVTGAGGTILGAVLHAETGRRRGGSAPDTSAPRRRGAAPDGPAPRRRGGAASDGSAPRRRGATDTPPAAQPPSPAGESVPFRHAPAGKGGTKGGRRRRSTAPTPPRPADRDARAAYDNGPVPEASLGWGGESAHDDGHLPDEPAPPPTTERAPDDEPGTLALRAIAHPDPHTPATGQ